METGGLSKEFLSNYLSTDSGISDRIQERRELSEKLESDIEFREKYISQNNKVPVEQSKCSVEDVEALIQRLNAGGIPEAGLTVIDENQQFTAVNEEEFQKKNKSNVVINVYGSNVKIYNVEKKQKQKSVKN